MAEPTRVPVRSAAPYDVVVGRDLAGLLPGLLGPAVQRVALLHATTVPDTVRSVRRALAADVQVTALPLPDGDAAKTAEVAARCWEALGEAGFTRSDAVVTVGGGSVTDLGGFVAATWLRGVRVVHVPTTLLAMVDAAVGGKTGINTGSGKNLVGSFHEPAGVLCDLSVLASLPRPELVAGLAEVVKCGFIADPVVLEIVESADDAQLAPDSPVLQELVERAVAVKAAVVAADLRETGGDEGDAGGHPGREVLNYGHTLAHAIERAEGYRIRHGEAVALGCVYAAELGRLAGIGSAQLVARHRSAFGRVGLPVRYTGSGFEELRRRMSVDKKARGNRLRFIVLEDVGRPRVLAGPDEGALRAAYDALAREPA